jgi:hypothetical protein
MALIFSAPHHFLLLAITYPREFRFQFATKQQNPHIAKTLIAIIRHHPLMAFELNLFLSF